MITKTQTPYEFLVRWDNGVVTGAHVRFLERIIEDGVVIHEKEGHAQPISMAGEIGFPIASILSSLESGAIIAVEAAQAATAAKVVELNTLTQELTKEKALHGDTKAQLAVLNSEIAALKAKEPKA